MRERLLRIHCYCIYVIYHITHVQYEYGGV